MAAFYPSLHLNLGEDHREARRHAAARHHLDLGDRPPLCLGDDPYGAMINAGLDGLAVRLPRTQESADHNSYAVDK